MSVRGMEGQLGKVAATLRSETELQKMLADEKMRSEQHKNNYQLLKTEHTRLQDEYVSQQRELKSTVEESRLVQDKYKGMLEHVRKELVAKHQDCEDLQTQVMTSQRLEVLKLKLTEEIEKPFRMKVAYVTEECDRCRAELNKVKYEYSFLKAEYEHEKNEHAQIVEELRLRHESEVTNLRKERETLLGRLQSDPGLESQRARTLQRDNAQLHLKVKGLLNELEEIRAQREHEGLQSDHVTRLQTKQLAEHAANVKALQTERDSLKLQADNLTRDLSTTTDLHTSLTSRVHELERDNLMLKNRTEEVTHKSKVELTSLKMDMIRERGELERQRDKLANECEDLKSQLDIAQCSFDAQSEALVEKEREAAKRVQAVLETEWTKMSKIENEKMELETKLQEIDRRKIDEDTRRQAEREAAEERMRGILDEKDEAEKEALVLKTKQQHYDSLMKQTERERTENSELKVRQHRLETDVQAYMTREHELHEQNQKLVAQNEHAFEQLRMAKDTFSNSQRDMDKLLSEQRLTLVAEKVNIEKRLEEQEAQLVQVQQRIAMLTTAHNRKKKKYAKIVSRLKDRLALASAKLEELKIERDMFKFALRATRRSVPSDQHTKLKKQLSDLLRRHCEFRTLISTTNPTYQSVALPTGLASVGLQTSSSCLLNDIELNAEKELEQIRTRMDNLDDNQRLQMDELRTVTKMVSPFSNNREMNNSI